MIMSFNRYTQCKKAHHLTEAFANRCGLPFHVITGRESHFVSELFLEFLKIVHFHRLRATAYHLQNLIEKRHRAINCTCLYKQ